MVLPFFRVVQAVAVSASLLAAPTAWAIDDTIQSVADYGRGVSQLRELGDELRILLRPEIGFPQEYIAPWQAAVDEAFAEDLLEQDYLAALEQHTTEQTRAAALAFMTSPFGTEMRDVMIAAEADRETKFEDDIARAGEIAEAASPEQNALFVTLFEVQHGPQMANAIMDSYYRMMKIGAEPVIGADAADEWVTGFGSTLREQYVEGYFLVMSAGYTDLDQAKLKELVETMSDPVIVDYAGQSTQAFSQALEAATDRLAIAYPKAITEQ